MCGEGGLPSVVFFQDDEGACFFIKYLYIIIYIFISNIIYLNIFSKSTLRESRTCDHGTGFLQVQVRESQKVPVGVNGTPVSITNCVIYRFTGNLPTAKGFFYQVNYGNLPRSCDLSCDFPKQVKFLASLASCDHREVAC